LKSEKGQKEQQEPQSGQNRIKVVLALVAVLLISGCVVFQTGKFTTNLRSDDKLLIAKSILESDKGLLVELNF